MQRDQITGFLTYACRHRGFRDGPRRVRLVSKAIGRVSGTIVPLTYGLDFSTRDACTDKRVVYDFVGKTERWGKERRRKDGRRPCNRHVARHA